MERESSLKRSSVRLEAVFYYEISHDVSTLLSSSETLYYSTGYLMKEVDDKTSESLNIHSTYEPHDE